MRSLRWALALGLAAGLVVLAPEAAMACSCVAAPLAHHVRAADSIGAGTVAWISEGADETTVAVDFGEVYKGDLGSREKVLTGAAGDTCALDTVEVDRRYVFFVQGTHRGRITANLCGGTTEATPAVRRRLEGITGAPHDPVPVPASRIDDAPHDGRWWIVAGGGALVLAAGAVWVAARRGRLPED